MLTQGSFQLAEQDVIAFLEIFEKDSVGALSGNQFQAQILEFGDQLVRNRLEYERQRIGKEAEGKPIEEGSASRESLHTF